MPENFNQQNQQKENLLESTCSSEEKKEFLTDKCYIDSSPVELSSKKRWFIIGIVIAFLNPIFSGLIFGTAMLFEPKLKKEGKIIIAISLIWAIIILFLAKYLDKAFPKI